MQLIVCFQCCKVTGDDRIGAEELKHRIKGDNFHILVVTPDIINNYFQASREASLSDFTLLIFDEVHHTKKKHAYNRLLSRYWREVMEEHPISPSVLPQVNYLSIKEQSKRGRFNPLLITLGLWLH